VGINAPEIDEAVARRESITSLATWISPLVGEAWKAWPYLAYAAAAIEKEIAKRGGGRVIVNLPFRHGKSLLTSLWLPTWFLENFPDASVILTSYEASIARRWGRKVRDVFLLEELWTKIGQRTSAANDWETTEGGSMRTAGAGGAITGSGGHLIVIDDPIKNWEEACSHTRRQNLRDWFESTLYTRREPGATIIVNMNRWHEDDLSGWLLREHTDDWTHVCLPGLAEENDPLGRLPGEALCPDRFPADDLRKTMAGMGQTKGLGMIQQRPIPGGGRIIRTDWCEKRFTVLPSNASHNCISVDASFKDGEKNSRVCIQAWARTRAEFFLLDQICRPMEFAETLDEVELMIRKWPWCRARYIEDKANGPAIISMLRKKVPGLIPVEPLGSKEARLQAVSPLFQSGSVILPDEVRAPWVADYVSELTSFPSAPFDDQVDATSQALLKMTERDASAGGGFGGNVPH
jgi:predicted phage terminase large subunit-like protein